MTREGMAIELRAVTKAFDGRCVLDAVDLAVPHGRALCILGRSGTGKSVTLKHIVGLIRPDEGRVLVHGEDVAQASPRELVRIRLRIGFLFQNAALFDSITVGENVAFPLRRHGPRLGEPAVRDRVEKLLADVGLEGEYDKMPTDLSGGMRKRAGLARALALDPDILLADEPSAGLDPVTSAGIDALLAGLRRAGKTLLVVTHNIPSARNLGEELVFLHEGRVLARGTPAELERSGHRLVRDFMQSEGTG